jgi:hypothetical protein
VADPKFTEEQARLLMEAVAIGRAMQHKFKPEPLYKHTGKGYMKSDGVVEIARLKEESTRDQGLAG